jgi:hypothetical protein
MRWRLVLGKLLWWAAAVALGLGSAWAVLRSVSSYGAAAGPWRVSTLAGSPEADLYTRARVALGGLLALNREETMYYLASTDTAGQPLRSRCRYRVTGLPPQARWWSVTAYAEDFFLFPNEQRRYSINGQTAVLDAQGRFAFVTGPQAPSVGGSAAPASVSAKAAEGAAAPVAGAGGNMTWLPTPGDRGLVFTLRVYNPNPALVAAPGTLQPPTIELQGACP